MIHSSIIRYVRLVVFLWNYFWHRTTITSYSLAMCNMQSLKMDNPHKNGLMSYVHKHLLTIVDRWYNGFWIEKCVRKKCFSCKYCWFFIIFKIKISVRQTTLALVSKNQVAFYFNIGHFMSVTSLNNWFIAMKLGLNLFVAKQNAKVCCQICFLFRI